MSKTGKLGGIIPAMVTAVTDDGSDVDIARTRSLTERLIDNGVHALFGSASTGEAPLLTRDQRIRVTDAIVETNLNANLPVLIGAGAMSTNLAIQFAKDAEAHGADYVAVMPLHFIKVSDDELEHYFASIADSIGIPTLLYNYPALTSQQQITPSLAAKLAKNHNVVGIKDSSGDLAMAEHFIDICGPDFMVFTGMETLLCPLLVQGGAGAICAAANVIPTLLVQLYNLFQSGHIEDAAKLQQKITKGSHLWRIGTFPSAVKAACALVGESVGPPFAPTHALKPNQIAELKSGLTEHFGV